jgi:hypothetical protein
MKSFFVLVCYAVFVFADVDHNSTKSSIDVYHGFFDSKVKQWGPGIDTMLLDFIDFFKETNTTQANTTFTLHEMYSQDINNSDVVDLSDLYRLLEQRSCCLDGNASAQEQMHYSEIRSGLQTPRHHQELSKSLMPQHEQVDEFFLTQRLLEERDTSYVRVSFIQRFASLEGNSNDFPIRARLGLGRTKKRLKLFIEDINKDSVQNIGNTQGDEQSPSLGLDLFSKERYGIRPIYSLGFRGIDPFARARFSYSTNVGRWHIEPIQTFTYSLEDEFSETTEFFMDTPTSKRTLLRFALSRGTQSYVPGMSYNGFIQWFFTPRHHAGLSFNLGANGSTKYENTLEEYDPPLIVQENRVFNYLFVMRWRENIWKKWLFYEIAPGVNYHEIHDYRPNYSVVFGIDLFFGHI